jgi:hypothetical protein
MVVVLICAETIYGRNRAVPFIDANRKTIVYNETMAQVKKEKPKKKRAKVERRIRTRLILPGEKMLAAEDIDENEGGMFLEKEDVQLIYHALREYKPAEKEVHLHSVLLEEFEEILVVDYDEIPPDVN